MAVRACVKRIAVTPTLPVKSHGNGNLGFLAMLTTTARTFAMALGILAALLAGCSSEPDPEFGQKREQQRAASSSDPYAPLGDATRPYRYFQASADQRQARVVGYAQTLRSSYMALLRKLDDEAVPPGLEAMGTACRIAYAEASRDPAAAAAPSTPDKDSMAATLASLVQCRTQAQAVEGDEPDKAYAALLKRFASAGIVLVGMTAVATGDEQAGMLAWRKGDAWVQEDKPGFELTLNAFR